VASSSPSFESIADQYERLSIKGEGKKEGEGDKEEKKEKARHARRLSVRSAFGLHVCIVFLASISAGSVEEMGEERTSDALDNRAITFP